MSAKVIRAHDPKWSIAFEDEASRLKQAFGTCLRSIDHIGGTSIVDIFTKPIVDILVQVPALAEAEARTAKMVELGYDARGEYGIPGRRYFSRKVSAENLDGYHVHVYESGSGNAARHLAFRNFLRLFPDVARAYSDLKRSLADPSGLLPADYAALKSDFVRDIERRALAHFAQSRLAGEST